MSSTGGADDLNPTRCPSRHRTASPQKRCVVASGRRREVTVNATASEKAATRWDRWIPHYALTAELLPAPNASWAELVYFAGTFDGYTILPDTHALQQFVYSGREQFASDCTLPEGMTMLRAALHGEQRADYWSDGEPLSDESLRYVHALVDRIRELVRSGAHIAPQPGTRGGIRDKVISAYDRLLVGYASWGGHRFHGWTSYDDVRNFLGPVVWSERDCGLRFAFELEKEWPGSVHMEFAIGKASRADFDATVEKAQRVDLAVSDLSAFVEDASTQERFQHHRHEAFFEVKWLLKGWRGTQFEMDARKRADQIPADLAKLARHVELGRCAVAGMLIFDDEGYFEEHRAEIEWPLSVWRLVVGPRALRLRGLLGEEPEPV